MHPALRLVLISAVVAITFSSVVAAVVMASSRPNLLVTSPSAATSTIEPAILTSGDAIVSRKPDLATVTAGIDAQQSTAAAAQSDLASKADKLIARIKALGVADKDLNTAGYWIGPVYSSSGQTIVAYRATEQLQVKWHNVDTVGKTLDAIVQEGGATNVSVGFALADPKSAEGDARSLAIGDARAKAQAMASAAGVKVGQVLRVSDLSSGTRLPSPVMYDGAAQAPTQVPVGELDVRVSVEVDFAIA